MFGTRKQLNELPIPAEAQTDENSRELIRAWAAHKGLHCTLSENNWGDNERTAWGMLLADTVRHIANVIHEQKGWNKAETVREIRRVFDESLEKDATDNQIASD
jgi:hypothetical protein